jgi:hypothetical protein
MRTVCEVTRAIDDLYMVVSIDICLQRVGRAQARHEDKS